MLEIRSKFVRSGRIAGNVRKNRICFGFWKGRAIYASLTIQHNACFLCLRTPQQHVHGQSLVSALDVAYFVSHKSAYTTVAVQNKRSLVNKHILLI